MNDVFRIQRYRVQGAGYSVVRKLKTSERENKLQAEWGMGDCCTVELRSSGFTSNGNLTPTDLTFDAQTSFSKFYIIAKSYYGNGR